jgi:TonB family protein
MNNVLLQKNNNSIFFMFIYSFIIHVIIFSAYVLFPNKIKVINEKQDLVYIQIASAPPSVQAPAQVQKPKDKSKIVKPKKLVQQKSISSKPSPQVEQNIEKPVVNSNPISSAQSEASDVYSNPVVEAVADEAARCQIPEIPITEDAANAGITAGKIVLEIQINADGKVTNATLLKGTGFKIDDVVLNLAKNLQCSPAKKDGKNITVIKRLPWYIKR